MAENEKIPDHVMKSYVWHEERCFFVSTIDRTCSALRNPSRYAETMAWAFDWDTLERGELVDQGEDSEGSITTHVNMCLALRSRGAPD